MNHSPEYEPRPDGLGSAFIDYLVGQAPDLYAAHRLRTLHARHGDATIAYLCLSDIDPYRESLVDDFADVYLGTFPDRKTFIASELEALGWTEKLNQLIACHDIPEGMLVWNETAFWAMLVEQYDVIERDGKLYVFNQ